VRSKLIVVSMLAAPLLMVGAAFADVGHAGDLPDPGDGTPVGFVADAAVGQAQVAAAPVGGGGGLTGAAALSTTTPAFSFFPDEEMPCSLAIEGPIGCGQAVEPEVKSAPDGTIFVTAQEGTPAGVMAWRRNPDSFTYKQLPKPDRLPAGTEQTGTTGGGGDNELAIGTPDPQLGGRYRVYASSLNSLVTNGVEVSTDRGNTWVSNPVASMWAGVDRQWLAAQGPRTVWLAYHEQGDDSILVTRSDDGGLVWGPPTEMMTLANMQNAGRGGGGNWEGNMVSLPGGGVATAFVANGPAGGTRSEVWLAWIGPRGGVHNVDLGSVLPTASGIFPSVAVDPAGNGYVAVTNQNGVFLSVSTDHLRTWTPFANVSTFDPTGRSASTAFPFVIAGAPGRVALAWLGSDSTLGVSDPAARWTVQFAYSGNALSASPSWTVGTASNHVVHTGVICLNGISCSPLDNSRALAEVVQMGHTFDGRILISYPDDHAGDHTGAFAYVVEEDHGPGLFGDVTYPPAPPPPAGGAVSSFTASGTLPLYFVNSGAGIAAGDGVLDKPGYRFDGVDIAGGLSALPGSRGHFGLIGYAANDNPAAANPVIFTGRTLSAPLTVGGALGVNLWVQDELGGQACSLPAECPTVRGETELDFSLLDVAPDGSTRSIIGHPVKATPDTSFVGGSQPTEVSLSLPITGGWQLLAGHHLQISMTFPFVTSSTMRLYYGDATYPSGISLATGS
jgi:hypothetical protein